MKKIISLIITVALILTASLSAFAITDNYTATASTNMPDTIKAGEDLSFTLTFSCGEALTLGCLYGGLNLNVPEGFTFVSGTKGDFKTEFTDNGAAINVVYEEDNEVAFAANANMGTFNFTVSESVEPGVYEFSIPEIGEYEINDGAEGGSILLNETTFSITVEGDEPVTPPVANVTPDKNAGAEVTLGENKYTGIYTYSLETNVTSFNLVATYNEGLTKNLKYAGSEAIELNNVAIKGGDATITFKIAIVGVPADVTISGLAIQAIQ